MHCMEFEPEIQQIDRITRETLSTTRGLAREVAGYIYQGGGKNLRSRLLLLAARSDAPFSRAPLSEDEPFLRMAAGVEILHTASLLHDDVVDKAHTRRGRPSVNAHYGEDVAILMADLFFSLAFEIGVGLGNLEALALICRTTQRMCESEIYQIEKRNGILTEGEYLKIIESKTATLFATCAELGAILAGASQERRAALAEFGRRVGMAFQIADDTLDYTASSDLWGKPVGNDLAQGKQTLPLVHVFEKAEPADRETLLHQLRNGRSMESVMPLIHKYGGLEYAAEKARSWAQEAGEMVPTFAPDGAMEQFIAYCRFAVERAY